MDIFRDMEEGEEATNGLKPELLPNTAFILKEPDPIKQRFIEKYDKFLDFYGWSQNKFDNKLFFGNNMYNRFKTGDYDPFLRTAERVLEDIYEYDRQRHKYAKDRCFKRIPKTTVRRNILEQIKLFCARNMVSEENVSDVFLGHEKILALFRTNNTSLRFSTIDKLFLQMYEEDKALIKDMGYEYERWKRSRNAGS